MPEPITTMTASAIASLAFQEFVKSGAGELAKKFTTGAIVKMGQLQELIKHIHFDCPCQIHQHRQHSQP